MHIPGQLNSLLAEIVVRVKPSYQRIQALSAGPASASTLARSLAAER